MDTGGLPGPGRGNGEPPDDALVGRNVGGKFVLEKQLGAGAMGAVYRARQTALEKVVAIKVMHGELARDPMFAARFHREAKAASRLDHPNSIRILDYGEDTDGLLYIAMEYLDGSDLAHILARDWPIPTARTVDLLSQALGAIAVAHDLGITHRDLKPENIMVLQRRTDDGLDIDVVKVCDFGIAKLVEGDDAPAATGTAGQGRGKLTTAGLVIGTPAYMSPEQGRGEAIDGRSDLYSMGVILYQLLTGQLPFDAPSAIGIVLKHQSETAAPPSSLRPDVDRHLEAACLRALAKSPADRFQTARELRAAIRSVIDPVAAPPSVEARTASLASGAVDAVFAKTELQLAAVPTPVTAPTSPVGAALASSGPAVGVAASTAVPAARRARWPLVAGLAVCALAGGLAWEQRQPAPPPHPAGGGPIGMTAPATKALPPAPPEVSSAVAPSPSSVPSVAAAADLGRMSPRAVPSTPGHTSILAGSRPGQTQALLPTEPAKVDTAPKPPDPPPTPAVAAPAALTPPPPPAAPVPAAPVAPAYDLAAATVVVGRSTNCQLVPQSSVDRAMKRVKTEIAQCYKRALPTMAGPLEGAGTLHLITDDDGTVSTANLTGPVGGAVAICIAGAARSVRIDDTTGTASADIPLEFRAR